mgnify:CR=1 FL=1
MESVKPLKQAAVRRKPNTLAALVSALVLYGAANAYIGWHGALFLRSLGLTGWEGLYWTLFVLAAAAYLLAMLPVVPYPAARLLKVVGACYFGVFEYALLLLPVVDLVYGIARLTGVTSDRLIPGLGGTVLATLAALFARGLWNARSPVVRTYDLKVDKPAGPIRELRVVLVSDLHLGSIVGNRHLDRLLAFTDRLQPDLILLAGDVIDDDIQPFVRNRMGERMRRLRARYGVFAVLGNHEYYGGQIEAYVREMKAAGIPVLRDEAVLVEGAFYVVGRKDKTAETADPAGRKTIGELVAPLDKDKPILVMDHQPTGYAEAEAAGVDVLVSGHTHRGQMAPNHWITRRLFELDWGYLRKGNMHAVVSSGFGTWGPPLRIMSRSEIVLLRIRFGPEGEKHAGTGPEADKG